MNYEKLGRVLERFVALQELRMKRAKSMKNARRSSALKKIRIVKFYNENGSWPHIKSIYRSEVKLAQVLENYVCRQSLSYDPLFRRLVLATGRKEKFKAQHNTAMYKEMILEFVKTHNRAPSTHDTVVEGERLLRRKLDYYTMVRNDMDLMGKVYAVDRCHKSGIQMKYRPIINSQLDISKPLIRLVKQETKENE